MQEIWQIWLFSFFNIKSSKLYIENYIPKNFRGTFCKLLEKLIRKTLIDDFDTDNLIYPTRSGAKSAGLLYPIVIFGVAKRIENF